MRLCLAALAEQILEEIAQSATALAKAKISRVNVAEIESVEAATGAATGLKRPMAELIIFLAELWVTQDVIGLGDLLESALGLLVAWVEVGMELPCQSSVGLFDLLVGR
jgi:hypothetical protein